MLFLPHQCPKFQRHLYQLSSTSKIHTKTLENTLEKKLKVLEEKYSCLVVEDSTLRPWDTTDRFKYDLNKTINAPNDGKFPATFSLALPPPNVTGSLHLGHSLTATLQDVLCRFMRLNGSSVCWLPGTDHAGIATQVVVEKYLAKKNITRYQLGYKRFNEEIWKWKAQNEGVIQQQLKSLGASLDWSKEVFTMDPDQSKAVKEAFVRLFDNGLIYRSNRLVNWSCSLNSSISDIEVDNIDVLNPMYISVPGYSKPVKFGEMYEIAYKVHDRSEEIVVATTRPETLLGDVAVAVHPEDKRYSSLVGSHLKHPFIDKTIPVISDESVEMTFGTGAVKITPAHDRNDYDIAERHRLEMMPVINEDGLIEQGYLHFSGMKRFDAREVILTELKQLELLRSVKPHKMVVPTCSRSGDIVELLPRPQWYVNCKEMYRDALEAIKTGELQLVPDTYDRIWTQWLDENKDWCISRQLWWGHRIPAYECYSIDNRDKSIWVAAFDEADAKVKSSKILNTSPSKILCTQDDDVLDTWFSSGIYPFSSHGWPKSRAQYKKLYPLSLMVTGHDITFFWVCRMIMLGTKLTGTLPFSKVLLHGIICDANGAKMSKSKGNVIEPQDVINGISLADLNSKARKSHANGIMSDDELTKTLSEQTKQFPEGIPQCGTDALRYTLCSQNVKNVYINFEVKECHSNKLFCNKIWQSLRFTQKFTDQLDVDALKSCRMENLSRVDMWLLSRLSTLVQSVYASLDNFDFHIATNSLKQFLYRELCDVYIECVKMDMKPVLNQEKMALHSHTLSACFNTSLRLLSPFMPFISEKLIPHIPVDHNCVVNYHDTIDNLSIGNKETLLSWKDVKLEKEFEVMLKIITTVRQIRSTYNVKKNNKSSIFIESSAEHSEVALCYRDLILFLGASEGLSVGSEKIDSTMWAYTADKSMKVYLTLSDSEDFQVNRSDAGRQMLLKKLDKVKKALAKLEKTTSSEGFGKKAPLHIQKSTKEKMFALREELKKLTENS
ncbi:valine--tRNA ligase-like [Arctopsyche grandis]|uniref:valine--tRNA ligase-like n=1 Tax=Arctopsyche grandis TaxID=121162 RepID=UPI00406D8778